MVDAVIVARDGPIARVTLNRPECGNLLSVIMSSRYDRWDQFIVFGR